MKTKPFLLASLLMLFTLPLLAQTQSGYVRTTGRPDNKDGKRISGVEIKFSGKHNAVVTNRKGAFNVNLGGGQTTYVINSVLCDGYELQEKELLGRREPVSETVQKEIVMVSLKEKRAIEENVRKQVEQKYQQKLASLQKQLRDKTISEEKYKSELKRLNDEYDLRDRLVHDMVERYANTDYAKLSAKETEINTFIERGELERADSVINSLNISQLERDRTSLLQDISAKERQISAERASVKSIDSTLWMAYRGKADIFFADFQNDSAIFYLEKLLTLDTTNVELMIEIGRRYDYYIVNKEKALYYLKKANSLLRNDSMNANLPACLNDMGMCYYNFDNMDSAKICLDEALKISRKTDNLQQVAIVLNNLQSYYGKIVDRETQKKCLEECLSIFKSLYGEKSAHLVTTYDNISSFYVKIGDFDKAIEYGNKALKVLPITRDIYDRIAPCYNNLGLVYKHIGKLDSSEYYYTKALKMMKTVYGENHPNVALVYGNLSYVEIAKGNLKEALVLRRQALHIHQTFFKGYHESIADDMTNMSTIFGNMEETDSLLFYASQAEHLYCYIDSFNPSMLYVYTNLGSGYSSKGDIKTALGYFIKADKIADMYPNENLKGIENLYCQLGVLFAGAGKNETALGYLNKSLDILNGMYKEDNFMFFVTLTNMGVLYTKMENKQKAGEYLLRAEKVLEKSKMTETLYAAKLYKSIGVLYYNFDVFDTAVYYFHKSEALAERFFKQTSEDNIILHIALMQCHYKMNSFSNSLIYADKLLNIYSKLLPENHPQYRNVYLLLYFNLHELNDKARLDDFMADKAFVIDVDPNKLLSERGYAGCYGIMEWEKWTIEDSISYNDVRNDIETPYKLMLYQNGTIYNETISGKAGGTVYIKVVGKDKKEELLKAYRNNK